MTEMYLGELRCFPYNFAPKGWAMCNGQILPINVNTALFSLLGTTYGGDGRVNFGLPNLQGRTPMHVGNGHTLGERGGEQAHTLSLSEIPIHTHVLQGTSATGTQLIPAGNLLAVNNLPAYHAVDANVTAMAANTVSNVGGSQAHLNMQPFLTLNFSIALQGIFPSQT